MARTRPPDFMDRLIEAGLKVFGRKGLKAARMSDVAHELRVSQGTLYNYVESKEALFGLLIERGSDSDPMELPSELPIAAPSPATLRSRLETRMHRVFGLPRLEAALAQDVVDDPRAELTAIVEELFARTAATRGPADALERSALDLPELFQTFFLGFRRHLFERYTQYVASRIRSGAFRPDADPRVAARFLVETVTFFARHRYRDPDPSLLPDAATIQPTVVPMVVAALLSSPSESPVS